MSKKKKKQKLMREHWTEFMSTYLTSPDAEDFDDPVDLINHIRLGPSYGFNSAAELQDDSLDAPCSNYSEVTIIEPATAVKNKRARTFSRIAKVFADCCRLTVVDDTLFVYDEESGCYHNVLYPERLLDRFLATEQADQLTKRDCDEIIERVKRLPYLQHKPDDFNCKPNLVNCLNGVIDLASTTSLSSTPKPHAPTPMFTYVINARYIPHWESCACPVFDRFCATSLEGSPVKRQLLLEMIGYICSDLTAGKCAFFLKGEPDSGKSVIAEFVRLLFEEGLVSSVPLHKLSDRFNKAELFGKKVNIAGEIKAKKLTEITTFKMVTGGDRILAEYKGKTPFYFSPRCKLLFSGNALPGTDEADSTMAFANRLVILLFNVSIPKEEQDKELLAKLFDERHAIFTKAMDALRELYYKNFRFSIPRDSAAFLKAYSYSENSVRAFVEDCCAPDSTATTFNFYILEAYKEYCHINGLEPRTRQQLYDAIDALPGVEARRIRIGSENRRGRIGVRLLFPCGTLEQEAELLEP